MLFNTILILSSKGNLWWIDPVVALICGLAAFFYALYDIYLSYVLDGLPIFKPRWWVYGGNSTSFSQSHDLNNNSNNNYNSNNLIIQNLHNNTSTKSVSESPPPEQFRDLESHLQIKEKADIRMNGRRGADFDDNDEVDDIELT